MKTMNVMIVGVGGQGTLLASRILGNTVLCEGFDGQSMCYVGRSWAESPDIDGKIYITGDEEIPAGTFVNVRITGAMDGELTGELVE